MTKSFSCLFLACLLALCLGGTANALSTPTIGTVIPASAPNDRDTPVVITGTGFATDGTIAPTVTLGATLLTAVTFVSETTLTASVPSGMAPGVYTLTVTNPDTGTSSLSGAFTVTLPPTVNAIGPSTAYNDIDTPVTITGTDFSTDATGTIPPTATLGTVALTDVSFVDATTLTAEVPWGMDPGTYVLTVTNPDGGSGSLSSAFTVDKGIGTWNGGTLDGGDVTQLLMKPGDPNTLYASAYNVGLFRSEDAGEHWSFLFGNTANDFVLDSLHPTWLYMQTFGPGGWGPRGTWPQGFYRSTDEGDTWTTCVEARSTEHYPDYEEIYPSPHDPQTLFLSSCEGWDYVSDSARADATLRDTTAFGLIRTTDGGANWKVVKDLAGVSVSCVTYHPTDPLQMVLGTTDGLVFQSTDGGTHWSEVIKPPISHIGVIAYNPFRPDEVWVASTSIAHASQGICKSTGAAFAAWQDRSPAWFGGTTSASFTGADTVYLQGIRSTDGGTTWQGFGPWPTGSGALAIDPIDLQIGYAGDVSYGVQKTTDGGGSWAIKNQGLTAMYCTSMAVSRSDPLRVWANFGWPGIHLSNDGAKNWTFIPTSAGGIIREDPFATHRIYAAGGQGFSVSTDGGESWSVPAWNASPTSPASQPAALEPDPSQPGHLLAGFYDGALYASTDYGASWQSITMPPRVTCIYDMAFDPSRPGYVYLVSTAAGVWRSTDGGSSWDRIDDRKQPDMEIAKYIAVASHPRHVLYVETAQRPYRSTDDGVTWEATEDPGYMIVHDMFADGDSTRLYSATWGGLYLSSNAGDTWERAAGVLGRFCVSAVSYTVADGHTILYAATTGGDLGASRSVAGEMSRRAAATSSRMVGAGIYRYVVVRPKLTLKLSGLSGGVLRLGHRVTAKGVVTPSALRGGKVKLQVQRWIGKWVAVRAMTRTIGTGGVYSWKYTPAGKGAYRVRATMARTAAHTAAKTTWRTFKVR